MEIKKISSAPPTYLIGANYRITLYSEIAARLEYAGQGVFDDEKPLILEPSFSEEVPHSLYTNGSFRIKTPRFSLELLPDGKCFDVGNLTIKIFDSFNGDVVCGPGVVDEANLGGAYIDLYKYPAGKTFENFTQGLLSKNGYFIFRNHCDFLSDGKTGWIKKRAAHDFQDWYLFAYGCEYKKAFGDFIRLFGKIPMIPRWAFGYWYSRWHKFRDRDIVDIVKKFREIGIPLDVFVIDTDWRKRGWNGYEWNREYFPDPAAFLEELKNLGVRTCLNDHPGYGVSDELPDDDPYREEIKKALPDIKDFRVYWNDDRYVRAWKEKIFTKILDEGIDFWWVDGWGASGGIMDLHSQLWLNRFYYESAAAARDGRRPMTFSRWGGLGSHKYPVQFSGDTYSTFETLKREISFTHQGGNIGAAYWSHDIGGFLGASISEDLFIRWAQFGCFAPIFRTHSSGASRDVREYSAEAVDIFKKYTRARHALNPYFYSLARECHETGVPPFRGLYVENPRDARAYENREEYLVGRSLLVAPAYEPGRAVEREVYFPEGVWVALEDIDIMKGRRSKKIKIPLDRIALYAKAGAIIPTTAPGDTIGIPRSLEIFVFPAARSFFDYYEDDGETSACDRGCFIKRRIETVARGRRTTVTIHPAEGSGYYGAPEKQEIVLAVFGGGRRAKKVLINGRKSGFAMSREIFSGTLAAGFEFVKISLGAAAAGDSVETEIFF